MKNKKERIEFLDSIIKITKESAKIGDAPMAYFKDDKGNIVVSVIALDKKYQTKMSLYTLKEINRSKEIIFITEAWMAMGKKEEDVKNIIVSEQRDKKECFIVNYFSKDKCLFHTLLFDRKGKSKKPIWTDEANYWECRNSESAFNPFKFKEEEIKEWLMLSEQDRLREEGKIEKVDLPLGFHIDIYRLKGGVFFETINGKGEVFSCIPVQKEDEEFKKKISEAETILKKFGGELQNEN